MILAISLHSITKHFHQIVTNEHWDYLNLNFVIFCRQLKKRKLTNNEDN